MRTAWKGTVQLGLLAIPVRLGNATDTKNDSLFHQMHDGCGGRIRQARRCELCEKENLEWGDIAKGVELADGTMVPVTDDELAELRVWEPKTIKILHFAQKDEIDPLLFDQDYYLEPVDGGAPAHQLLAAAMSQTEGLAAVCEVGWPHKLQLALMHLRDGKFVVTLLRWPSQVRVCDVKVPPVLPARPQEVTMATRLVKSMTKKFDPDEHTDAYRERLVELVTAKASGSAPAVPAAKDQAQKYTDMMDLLQASIAAQKATTKPRARKTPAAKAS